MCVEELDGVGEKSWKSHEMVQRCRATSGTLQRLRWIFLDCLTLLFSFLSVWGERRKWGEQLVLNWSSGKRLVSATPPAVQAALQLQSILPYKFTTGSQWQVLARYTSAELSVCVCVNNSAGVRACVCVCEHHDFLFSFHSDIPHVCVARSWSSLPRGFFVRH